MTPEPNTKTLDSLRGELESISHEFRELASKAEQKELDAVLVVVRRAEDAREKILDLSVAMTKYVQLCLDREDTTE